jgi:hypothetical protein
MDQRQAEMLFAAICRDKLGALKVLFSLTVCIYSKLKSSRGMEDTCSPPQIHTHGMDAKWRQ